MFTQRDTQVFLVQERSDVAQKIINAVKKKRGKMIRGMEHLCDAYITLAYMDASKHKLEKSELSEHRDLNTETLWIHPAAAGTHFRFICASFSLP